MEIKYIYGVAEKIHNTKHEVFTVKISCGEDILDFVKRKRINQLRLCESKRSADGIVKNLTEFYKQSGTLWTYDDTLDDFEQRVLAYIAED